MGSSLPMGFLYTLQGYLYTLKKEEEENYHYTHRGFAENHLAHLEQKVDSSLFS